MGGGMAILEEQLTTARCWRRAVQEVIVRGRARVKASCDARVRASARARFRDRARVRARARVLIRARVSGV